MRNGPLKIILINAGKYDYAEVELDGALQIVGGNNYGKTTLINTLQFLYIDERSKMSFGAYDLDQTLEYYFPGRFSYVLFECRTLRGQAVIGWRGSSKQSGSGPERFCYLGPYQRGDFFTERGAVREPLDVSATLSTRADLQFLAKPQQHRELLLAGAGERGNGFGIVSLKDNDKFHHFRETLKNLLTLKDISQEQMRDRLLMLADIPTDQPALEKQALLGDDHDRIQRCKEELDSFIKHKQLLDTLVEAFAACQKVRSHLMYHYSVLTQQRTDFQSTHQAALCTLDDQVSTAQKKQKTDAETLIGKRGENDALVAQRTTLENNLAPLPVLSKEFAGFAEELEQTIAAELEKKFVGLEALLSEAASEKLEDVQAKIGENAASIIAKELSIKHFGELVVTALRQEFNDEELSRIFGVLNPEILALPLGRKGITVTDHAAAIAKLRGLLACTRQGVYQDDLLTVRFRPASAALSKLESVEKLEAELSQLQREKDRLEKLKDAVNERGRHEKELALLRAQKNKQNTRLNDFAQFKRALQNKGQWEHELALNTEALGALKTAIGKLEDSVRDARDLQRELTEKRREQVRQHDEVLKQFGQCNRPIFDEGAPRADGEIPPDFDSSVGVYLHEQNREKDLARDFRTALLEVQKEFGDRYNGATDGETVRTLRDEMEAADEKEKALKHDWDAHIKGLKRRFKEVLDDLGSIQLAATQLTKSFGQVQVSDLKHIKITAEPNADLLGIIKRLAGVEELDLWADQTPLDTALKRLRELFEHKSIIRVSELFTLGVSVTGADGKVKHYHKFDQVESDGTTVTVKVLFNLLALKSLLRKDDVAVPFFLDELEALDAVNCRAILKTAKALGFIAITAAPRPAGEVDACYFLERRSTGRVKLTATHRLELRPKSASNKAT